VSNAAFGAPAGTLTNTFQFYDAFSFATTQTGNFRVVINNLPQSTAFGRAFKFDPVDPSEPSAVSTEFDGFFPFLKDEAKKPLLEVDTSLWFINSTPVTYSVNLSDSSEPLPSYLHFNPLTGTLRVDPGPSEPSRLLHLKFQATNSAQGTATLYKQLLVNSPPLSRRAYRVLQLYLLRKMSEDLQGMFWDPNPGDQIEYSMPEGGDRRELEMRGLVFEVTKGVPRIVGTPVLPGIIGKVKVRATDTHGAWSEAYLTIKVEDARVAKRGGRDQQDKEVVERQRFYIKLRDDMFYDRDTG
jgi:hypothetical protein